MSCIKDGNVNLITTRHVSATLMSAIKENPGANGFIISGISSMTNENSNPHIIIYFLPGYPRSMRDTSEYLELIGRLDAVILINWHLYTLERQIQNGSKV